MIRWRLSIAIVLLVFASNLAGYSWHALHAAAAPLQITNLKQLHEVAGSTVSLPWPAYGGSALSIDGSSITLSAGSTKQSPTASVAKVMTALAVLDKKPLAPGTDGVSYTITADDVTSYVNYVAKDGSVVPVQAGEVLTERQMLQALLLPSANNIADTLASWAFGSLPQYVQYANQKAAELGMKDSYFSDASGFSPATVSTPADLVKLGNAALKNGALMEIASQKSAAIPVAGTIYNVNSLLGQDGVIGLKTGNTDEAGGCFLMAGRIVPNGGSQPVTVVTAIMAAPNREIALRDSLPFMRAVANNFELTTIAEAGTALYQYTAPWGGQTKVVLKNDLTVLRWKNSTIQPQLKTIPLQTTYRPGQTVGTATVKTAFQTVSSPVVVTAGVDPPSKWWHLTHPAD